MVEKLYEKIAATLMERIEKGFYTAGHKLPSIRVLAGEYQVSISTAQEAYRLLEERGYSEVRPKSGHFVKPRVDVNQPKLPTPDQFPVKVSLWDKVLTMLSAEETTNQFNLGWAVPDLEAQTLKPLLKSMSQLNRNADIRLLGYDRVNGCAALRTQVARLAVESGCQLSPDEIIITSGCQEALSCALRAVTEPGDVVAIDSPCYFGAAQTIEVCGLKALEIPTHPETGISIEALELALEQWPIKAIAITPTCNNPLGYTVPDEHKARIVELCNKYDIALIEDDIYGDLSFQYPRPRTVKSFDTQGRVILCSSFSKTLAPGFRVGWLI
ncbi:MAG: PLP-dependent aminotransferase family protein, partial [Pontibacterium sp.]